MQLDGSPDASEPTTRIGAIHWRALTAGTDGEHIVLTVPAFFESHHVQGYEAWLCWRR